MKKKLISAKSGRKLVIVILTAVMGILFTSCTGGKKVTVEEISSGTGSADYSDDSGTEGTESHSETEISCSDSENAQQITESSGDTEKEESGSEVLLGVHVTGAVKMPDRVWLLPEGSRVEDAVKAAGGALENADLSALNLAEYVQDGERIYVPTAEETADSADGTQSESEWITRSDGSSSQTERNEEQGHLTNINSATKIELMELPGIGEAYAQRIIDYRESNGSFATIEEIMNVSGIGESRFADLKDLITVE